jgi:TIR domain
VSPARSAIGESNGALLFISYASPDVELAEWLARRLTVVGYEVWFDRWKLLGGEDWSRDIGRVLKEESFRVLHLLSRSSSHDSYAASERARALDIGRMRKEDFLIPLLVEPLDRSELPFELANRTLLDFTDWGRGIEQLFEKLEKIGASKRLDPQSIPLLTGSPGRGLLLEESETLFSNALWVEQIPAAIKVFRLSRIPSPAHYDAVTAAWAYWRPRGAQVAFSFTYPPSPLPGGIEAEFERSLSWQDLDKIEGQPVETMIPALLRKTLAHRCRAVGLQAFDFADGNRRIGPRWGWFCFPQGLLQKDKRRVRNWAGKLAPVGVVGHRRYRGERFRSHLAFAPVLQRIARDRFLVFIHLGIYPFTVEGKPYSGRSVNARLKAATRRWKNSELLNRFRVVFDVLAEGHEALVVGDKPSEQVILRPLRGTLDIRLDEEALDRLGAEAASGEADDVDGEEDDD